MKHHSCPFFIPLLLSVLIVTACGDMGRMRSELANLQARNQADSLLTDDSLALVLTHYFDRHGTPNERMLAHYLLARTYVDQGEAPHALDEFHQAAGLADTTSNDCDYALLSRVHGQTAELLYSMLLPNEMLEELRMAEHFAWKAGDTIMALIVYDRQNFAYDLLGQQDTAMTIARHAYENYMHHGYPSLAASSASTLFFNYVDLKDWKQAERYMEIYEKESGFFFDGEILQGREIHYYYKGKYFIGIAQYDSAEFYFRKELRLAQDSYNREAAYQGLYDLYRHLGVFDSVVKYADSCYQSTTESYRNNTVERLRHMHALYNYEAISRVALQKSAESREMRLWLYVLSSLFTVVALVVYILWRRKEERQKAMERAFHSHVSELRQAQNDLIALHEQNVEKLVKEKNEKIELLEDKITQYASLSKHFEPDTLEERLHSSSIYALFHSKLSNPTLPPSEQHWQELYDMINRELPRFFSILNSGKKPLSQDEYRLCILIRLGFRSKDCFVLMNIKPNRIANLRKSLLGKVFNQEGSSDDFDKKIMNII